MTIDVSVEQVIILLEELQQRKQNILNKLKMFLSDKNSYIGRKNKSDKIAVSEQEKIDSIEIQETYFNSQLDSVQALMDDLES